MILELRSLVGLSCIDSGVPEASEKDIEMALLSSSLLRSGMEKIPELDLTQVEEYENKPDFTPEPAPTMQFRR